MDSLQTFMPPMQRPQIRKGAEVKAKKYLTLLLLCLFAGFYSSLGFAQTEQVKVLRVEEFLDIVRAHHPVALQAELLIQQANSEQRAARGAFDPKLYANVSEKDFKDLDYFRLIESGLKIPTWIGLDIKAGYEQNRGVFLNPENSVPSAGLWFAEFSLPLGKGLFIDKRRAELKKANLLTRMNEEVQKNLINDLLYESGKAYWDWFRTYNELVVYREALSVAQQRFDAILTSANLGERPTIDTLEARIQVQNRLLSVQQADLDYQNSSAQLSVYLWANGTIPLEVEDGTIPFLQEQVHVAEVDDDFVNGIDTLVSRHPLLEQARIKIDQLKVDVRLKKEQLKPTLNLSYKPITEPVGGDILAATSANNFEWGLEFSVPLFLRKERGNVQLANLNVRDQQLDLISKRETQLFKAKAAINELDITQRQIEQFEMAVENYSDLLAGEQRKFNLGESSLFLINSRESSLISSRIKLVELYTKNRKSELLKLHAFGLLGQATPS